MVTYSGWKELENSTSYIGFSKRYPIFRMDEKIQGTRRICNLHVWTELPGNLQKSKSKAHNSQ